MASHSPRLKSLLQRRGASRQLAEEILQDVFAMMLQPAAARELPRLATFRGESALGTWMATIALRLLARRQRQPAARHTELGDDLAAPTLVPESTAERVLGAIAQKLRQACATMPGRARSLLHARIVQQLPQREIARRLGLHESRVSHRLAAAIQCLRRAFRDRADADLQDCVDALPGPLLRRLGGEALRCCLEGGA